MGSGSSSTSAEMNPAMAAASTYATLKGQVMTDDLWNMTKPYYQQQLDFSNDTMNPYYTELYKDSQSLLPAQTALSQSQIQESQNDIARNAPVKDALTTEQLKELSESSPVREKFYQEALKGVDPNYEQVMGQATGDVEQQYANSESSIRRNLAKTGLSPDSGAYATALSNAEFSKAKDKAFAKTNAYMTEKNNVETQNWNRLAQGVSTAGRASGLSGVSDSSQSNASSKTLNSSTSTNPYSSSDASSGTTTALSGMFNAANSFANLGKANSTTTTSGGDSGWGSVLGTGAGMVGSYALSSLPKMAL